MRLPLKLALVGFFLGGCAYYSTSGGLIGGIRSVGIPVAANQSSEFAVAERLTERAIDAYTQDGRLRVVDEEGADALMQLEVISIDDRPFTYTAAEETEQYRFAVLVAAEATTTPLPSLCSAFSASAVATSGSCRRMARRVPF